MQAKEPWKKYLWDLLDCLCFNVWTSSTIGGMHSAEYKLSSHEKAQKPKVFGPALISVLPSIAQWEGKDMFFTVMEAAKGMEYWQCSASSYGQVQPLELYSTFHYCSNQIWQSRLVLWYTHAYLCAGEYTVHCIRMRSSLVRMRSSLARMRSSLVARASDCQCTSCNGPGFDPSMRRRSGIWGAADEAVLNIHSM